MRSKSHLFYSASGSVNWYNPLWQTTSKYLLKMNKPTTYNLEVPCLSADLTNAYTHSPKAKYKNTGKQNLKTMEAPTNNKIKTDCARATQLQHYGWITTTSNRDEFHKCQWVKEIRHRTVHTIRFRVSSKLSSPVKARTAVPLGGTERNQTRKRDRPLGCKPYCFSVCVQDYNSVFKVLQAGHGWLCTSVYFSFKSQICCIRVHQFRTYISLFQGMTWQSVLYFLDQ